MPELRRQRHHLELAIDGLGQEDGATGSLTLGF